MDFKIHKGLGILTLQTENLDQNRGLKLNRSLYHTTVPQIV